MLSVLESIPEQKFVAEMLKGTRTVASVRQTAVVAAERWCVDKFTAPPVASQIKVRCLEQKLVSKLSDLLDPPSQTDLDWRGLCAELGEDSKLFTASDVELFTASDVELYTMQYGKQNGSPTEALLRDLGARTEATVRDLFDAFKRMKFGSALELLHTYFTGRVDVFTKCKVIMKVNKFDC